ncbi:SDR family NAD(P)-dependent oxidoreductase [Nocardiopsis potens]|uniref:SDR family NAD(P)-dependent oxidoreductase n=1 Tax=Nocardiopsis potens TaxID=1246458 RepID=UPI000344EDE3|nr:SDR family NAD(P)-dependent oxidoreductase [Nocardiopsis potens]
MDTGLEKKRVLVTGGTRGVGRATALAFARAGAQVAVCHRGGSRPDEELAAAVQAVHRADVSSPADVAALAAAVGEDFGGLDVLVNNVGADGAAPLAELAEEEWARVLDLNATSVYRVIRAALPLLGEGASVVSVGAAAAMRGRPAAAHYSAAKAALIGLTRSLCKELGPRGIRVNAIAPGMVDGGGAEPPGPIAERIIAATPLGRLCRPEDVAGAALFLGGDTSAFLTGTTINLDGGI